MAKKALIEKQKRTPKYKVRAYTRCRRCGRPRAVYRRFGLCRICLREMVHAGEVPGVTTAMMVTLGEDGVKSIEDFAGYAVDDLVGWKERKDGETKFFPGVLASHGVTRVDAEQMVLAARLAAGWITADEAAVEADAPAEADA